MIKNFIFLVGGLLALVIFIVFYFWESYSVDEELEQEFKQQEVNRPGELLLPNGQLEDIGWSRQPLKIFKDDYVQELQNLKRWEQYFIMIPDTMIMSFHILTNFRGTTVDFYLIDLLKNDGHLIAKVEERYPDAWHKIPDLPDNGSHYDGSIAASFDDIQFTIKNDDVSDPLKKLIHIDINSSSHNISAKFTLAKQKDFHEIALMQPLHFDIDEPWIFEDFIQAFIYQIKTYNLEVQGYLNANGNHYDFKKYFNSIGGRNWGRIYTIDDGSNYLWMAAQGYLDNNQMFALNLGAGKEHYQLFDDQNAVFINGRLFKIGMVDFTVPDNGFDGDKGEDWFFKSDPDNEDQEATIEGRFRTLKFYEKPSSTYKNEVQQNLFKINFGYFSGRVTLPQGQNLIFSEMLGFVERNRKLIYRK